MKIVKETYQQPEAYGRYGAVVRKMCVKEVVNQKFSPIGRRLFQRSIYCAVLPNSDRYMST